jgi:trypsin
MSGGPRAKIFNGGEAKAHSLPFQVALRLKFRSVSEVFCGGSLISPNYVLTAAHCTGNIQASDLLVIVGLHNLRDQGEKILVEEIIQHRAFSGDPTYDKGKK